MVDGSGVAGTTISSVSLFVQLVDGCVQAFSLWQKGKEIGSDAVAFQVRMEMQAARLKEWALNWGIGHAAKPFHLFEPRFRVYGDLAVKYIATINHLLSVLDSFATDHPVIASASNLPLSAASHIARLDEFSDSSSTGRRIYSEKIGSIQENARTLENLHWSTDEARASKALGLIKEMIDDLYSFFEPPRKDAPARIVFNACLASRNLNQLENMRETCDEDPLLRGLSYLKTALDRLDRGSALDLADVIRKYRLLKETEPADSRSNRSWGTFKKIPVMVEWKTVTGVKDPLDQVLLEKRINNVARLLKAELKPRELRTLACLGVVTRTGPQNASTQYGLLFQIPSLQSRTLMGVLNEPTTDLDLGDLFAIAQKLSEALLFLHLAGWLHKGIRSENILFFGADQKTIQLNDPHIVGFEYSRESKPNSMTEGVSDDLEFNLYRHPEVQGVPEEPLEGETSRNQRPSFSQNHDVYSLGVILIELGTMKPALQIMREAEADPSYGTHCAARFSEWLREKELPKLGRRMGKTYREAAELCLTGKFAEKSVNSAETGLYLEVVRPLTTCYV